MLYLRLRCSESAIQEARTLASTVSMSHASIIEYKSLQDFVSTVSKSCSQVEDGTGPQSLQLVKFLEAVKEKTWADIQSGLSTWEPGHTILISATKTCHVIEHFSLLQKSYVGLCQLITSRLHQRIRQHLKKLFSIYSSSNKCQFCSPLIAFQYPFYSFSGDKIRYETGAESKGLYPLQVLIQPVSLRFKYHFEGSRQTNRLDKVGGFRSLPLIAAHAI